MGIFSKLFNRNRNQLIGIDIGSGFIKVAEIAYEQNLPLLTAVAVDKLPAGAVQNGLVTDPPALASQLRRLLLTTGCRGRSAAFAVGGQAAVVRQAEFPFMTWAELTETLRWEIGGYIPFPPDSYYYDYTIVGNPEPGMNMRLLLVAARGQVVDALTAVARLAGLKPVAVDVEMLAAGRTLAYPDATLLVDIGEMDSQLAIFREGTPVVVQTRAVGGQSFTLAIMRTFGLAYQEAELLKLRQPDLLQPFAVDQANDIHAELAAVAGELAAAITQTSEFYQTEFQDARIDKVVLSGGGAKLSNLGRYLEAVTGLPVVLAEPQLCPSASFDPQYIRDCIGQLTVAIGLALRGGK